MPYVITKSNGQTLTVIEDAEVDITSTSLSLIGKNYSGYGLVIDQNFVKLLENFSNSSHPENVIQGQLWYDSSAAGKRLNVYDGKNFKPLANLTAKDSTPIGSVVGDLWWDTKDSQLRAWNGNRFVLVGPPEASSANANWIIEKEEYNGEITSIIRAEFDGIPSIAITGELNTSTFFPASNFGNNFVSGIKQGITLAGCNEEGSSAANGYYFWGTASDALSAKVKTSFTSSNATHYVSFVNTTTPGNRELLTTSTFFFNPSTNVLNATATAARYADLAERYESDEVYAPGTVVIVGGPKEITTTNVAANTAVAGVISKYPAYMMNSEAGNDATHPYVALKGRVICKVYGPVTKGDMLVTSRHPGYACAYVHGDHPRAVFATALQSFSGEFGSIEVKI